MAPTRIQLTLFVDDHEAAELERIRAAFNPAQHRLIKSHVTLCREDELTAIERITQTLRTSRWPILALDLGPARRFSDGKGVLIPVAGDDGRFQDLRRAVLHGAVEPVRVLEPHITLMHPRNSTCTDLVFAQIAACRLPDRLTFRKISLIAQVAGGPWSTLEEVDLLPIR